MECSSDKIIKARTEHKCIWCGEQIHPGDTYVRWACFDGGVGIVKIHPECQKAWGKIREKDKDFELYQYGRFEHGSAEKKWSFL